MKISVIITLKKDVLDPQGKVIQQTLQNMGLSSLKNLRQGKYIEIELNESPRDSPSDPRESARLLKNPPDESSLADPMVSPLSAVAEDSELLEPC